MPERREDYEVQEPSDEEVIDSSEFHRRLFGYAPIPTIVGYMGLTPYEIHLYRFYVDFIGYGGLTDKTCYQKTRTTARILCIDHTSVSRTRRSLADRGLIFLKERWPEDTPRGPRNKKVHVTINPDIWDVNTAYVKLAMNKKRRPRYDAIFGWTVTELKRWLLDGEPYGEVLAIVTTKAGAGNFGAGGTKVSGAGSTKSFGAQIVPIQNQEQQDSETGTTDSETGTDSASGAKNAPPAGGSAVVSSLPENGVAWLRDLQLDQIEDERVFELLVGLGVADAKTLMIGTLGVGVCRRQLQFLPDRVDYELGRGKTIGNLPGLLRASIIGDWEPPPRSKEKAKARWFTDEEYEQFFLKPGDEI